MASTETATQFDLIITGALEVRGAEQAMNNRVAHHDR
jgi:hypothetical protein